jgi:hypothetical protein
MCAHTAQRLGLQRHLHPELIHPDGMYLASPGCLSLASSCCAYMHRCPVVNPSVHWLFRGQCQNRISGASTYRRLLHMLKNCNGGAQRFDHQFETVCRNSLTHSLRRRRAGRRMHQTYLMLLTTHFEFVRCHLLFCLNACALCSSFPVANSH